VQYPSQELKSSHESLGFGMKKVNLRMFARRVGLGFLGFQNSRGESKPRVLCRRSDVCEHSASIICVQSDVNNPIKWSMLLLRCLRNKGTLTSHTFPLALSLPNMCEVYKRVYTCGHYKTGTTYCTKKRFEDQDACTPPKKENASTTGSYCGWKGCDKKANLERDGPTGKPDVRFKLV
jgi:hypothetical protein